MKSLNVLLKPVSGMCNMNCEYCFYCDETKRRSRESYGRMTEQTLKNVIRKTMLRAEEISYAFQGGEPTLCGLAFYERAMELQKQYHRNGVRVHNALQTNGYLIDEAWCAFFKKHQFLVGLSVDGIRETHDAYRRTKNGEGTFDRVLQAAKLLERYGVEYNILTVVTKETASHIAEIYRFYKAQGWKCQQYIACMEPLDDPGGNCEASLTPQMYGSFLIELFELWYRDWEKGCQPYIRRFENYIGILLGYLPEACENRGICGIQNVVEADGSVYPCDFYVLDEYYLGNFNTDQLEQIDERRKSIRFLERSLQLSGECRACRYFSICRGGCQRNRFREGAFYQSRFCESYRMFFDACMPKLEKIAKTIDLKHKKQKGF